MAISYQPTIDLEKSAELTYKNMRQYYEHFSSEWDTSSIVEQILSLQNWDILQAGEVIGVFRLSTNNNECWLRDLQVDERFQNIGVGGRALEEVALKAVDSGADSIKLRVFKISPAHHLYRRSGFEMTSEDEKFYYMNKRIKT